MNRSISALGAVLIATSTIVLCSGCTRPEEFGVGFIPYDDIVSRDPISGNVKGLMHDILQEVLLERGIDSSSVRYYETSWDSFFVGLNSGKYDLCIAGTFQTPDRERLVEFLSPLFYLGNGAMVRTDDARFREIQSVDDLDMPGITVAVVMGEYGYEYARGNFTRASMTEIPGPDLTLAPNAVRQGRADVALSDQYILRKYEQQYPETHDVLSNAPYHVLPICWSVRKGNSAQRESWNNSLEILRENGRLEEVLERYSNKIPFALAP